MALRLSTGLRNKMLDTGSVKTIFAAGSIEIYTGVQPADADQTPTGSLLVSIDMAGAGINFEVNATAGTLEKLASEVWSANAAATGTAGWYRLKAAADTDAVSTTEARIDGTVGTFGADLAISSTAVVSGAPQTIDAYSITIPTA